MKSSALLLATLLMPRPGQVRADDSDFTPRICATRADGSPAWELAALKEFNGAYCPELSPDGTWLAVHGTKDGEDSENHIFLINLNDAAIEDLGRGAQPSWSADGAMLAYSDSGPNEGVCIRPVVGGLFELIDAEGWAIRWSPDGKRLAYLRGNNLIIYDPATKTKRAVFPENESLPYEEIFPNFGWSPDSKRICLKGLRQTVAGRQQTVNPAPPSSRDEIAVVAVDGDPQLRTLCEEDGAWTFAWHPDNSRILISKGEQVYELNLHTNDSPRLVRGMPAGRTNVGTCWSPDGEILVFISFRPRP